MPLDSDASAQAHCFLLPPVSAPQGSRRQLPTLPGGSCQAAVVGFGQWETQVRDCSGGGGSSGSWNTPQPGDCRRPPWTSAHRWPFEQLHPEVLLSIGTPGKSLRRLGFELVVALQVASPSPAILGHLPHTCNSSSPCRPLLGIKSL